MNEVNPETKSTVAKILTLIGFVAMIVLTVYLVVRVVNMVPDRLANLTEPDPTDNETETEAGLTITADKYLIGLDEPVTISWSGPIDDGIYTFTAECDEGVILSRETADNPTPLLCHQVIGLDGETGITLTALESETEVSEVYYVIGLLDPSNGDLVLESESYFTITNPTINTNQAEENPPVLSQEPETPDIEIEPSRPSTETATEQPVYTTVYGLPVSDPNGLVDLTASHFVAGYLTAEQNFLRSQAIDNDFRGAIRFMVKNIGTKTSDEWHFVATLPSGQEVTSKREPLKPNEEATITLGFTPGNHLGNKTVSVRVYSQADFNQNNNHFIWSVPIVD